MYEYKGSHETLGPTFKCQSVPTIKQPFHTGTDICAQLSQYLGKLPFFCWGLKLKNSN